jgi:ATP-dependent DNA helicase DinG
MTRYSLTPAVRRAFGDTLPAIMGEAFEAREQQADMALAVASLIEAGGVEVVEAETGLGKSLAYLVPLVLHCAGSGERAVVSTYTRNLQRQLIDKDYPLACRAAGVRVDGISLMGRGNYLCRRRAQNKARSPQSDPDVRRWLRSALADDTGEVDAVPGASYYLDASARAAVVSPSRDAVCAGCDVRGDCYMLRARRRALDARVVVTNHALLFSDLASSGALLGPYDVLVVDEAHHLEDVATDFFSLSYSPLTIAGAAHSVYTPELEETAKYVRAMVAAESDKKARSVDSLWSAFHNALENAKAKTADLFAVLSKNAAGVPGRNANGRDAFVVSKVVYEEGAPLLYGAEETAAAASRALAEMETAAGAVVEVVEDVPPLAVGGVAGSVRAIRDAAAETRAEFDFLVSGASEDHVFYAQLDEPSRVTALAAAPVDVSDRLGAVLEEGTRAAVLTSATLAVDGDFSYTLDRLGLTGTGAATTRRYESPFDFDQRRLVLLPDYLSDPSHEAFLPQAATLIRDAVAASGRRVLVLCTARGQVTALGRLLSNANAVGAEVLTQDEGTSREDLLERFRRSRRGVLVGLASFWEGIDLPGEQLELLVVVKLPFMVPTEPLARARASRMEASGENAFERLYLPDVVLKLRQGMGRLIRTSSDRGVVILLDRRLTGSRYGEYVLRAITDRFVRCDCGEEAVSQIEEYFHES